MQLLKYIPRTEPTVAGDIHQFVHYAAVSFPTQLTLDMRWMALYSFCYIPVPISIRWWTTTGLQGLVWHVDYIFYILNSLPHTLLVAYCA